MTAPRVIIYGLGAVGGLVAAGLVRSGTEVLGIARGAMLEALRTGPLRLRAPGIDETHPVPVVADPSEIDFRPDDLILLTMKGQDTEAALLRLLAAGVTDQAIFCLQNGVANERAALRHFPNVHGVTVMMPAKYIRGGDVAATHGPKFGIYDIGRYPRGADEADETLAQLLNAGNIASFVSEDVMPSKYGKLLVNMGNVIEAALGPGVDHGPWSKALQDEAIAIYDQAGIAWLDVRATDPQRSEFLRPGPVPGTEHLGSSSTQSLQRGTGSIETAYMNGEIALIARLHGLAAPLNTRAAQLGVELLRQGLTPGTLDLAALSRWMTGDDLDVVGKA